MDPSTSTWSRCLEHAVLSDVGLRRANNQDSCAAVLAGGQADFQQRGHLFMVADGMGAHAAGELASKMAADIVSLVYRKRLDQAPPEAILSAFLDANHQIHSRGQASPDFRGMGTTGTALILLPTGAMVAHVGDSRAYRVRGTVLEQLTFDHSLVWELRAAGPAPGAAPPGYVSKNIITRSLGPNAVVQVDLEGPYPVQAGDTFLLCSDGLSGQVKDDEIGMVLSCLPPDEAVRALVDLANLRGGPDNITVVVARVVGPQISQNTKPDQPAMTAVSGPPVHPAIWTGMGVSILAAAAMLALDHPLAALMALMVTVGTVVAILAPRWGAADRRSRIESRRFGRGPYVTCECAPNADLLSRLTNIIQQLRDAATKEKWSVDWAGFERFTAQATSANQSGNSVEAAREYLHAISFLMAQLRQQKSASMDSGIMSLPL
jgi:PPM family protein phosphatase